jgi:hypothetical protein
MEITMNFGTDNQSLCAPTEEIPTLFSDQLNVISKYYSKQYHQYIQTHKTILTLLSFLQTHLHTIASFTKPPFKMIMN